MYDTVEPAQRGAAVPDALHDSPVTLLNSFVVAPDRDAAFTELWGRTSAFFRAQPGFLGLRLHRAVSPDTHYRYVNVATWASAEQFRAAHQLPEFLQVVGQLGWQEFPSNPALYEVVVDYAAPTADAHT